MQKKNQKEVESAINGVGSTIKPIKAMDARSQLRYACMIPEETMSWLWKLIETK
jgi:hypothetical protein